ncbi:type IA DNA topoisomerase [Enterococcus sp. BWR-S5]|uniref:type IA DNA topoisomerase n=1 Tax=Enterococcus sp. BWR-S5 TaxID=2787714 RepID=UPI001923F37A|nr:type IA DNA topoisomerase [Enterococcus sp. BWR-S5]MBL1227203.1 DNA topoisomerase III [Enterococcus sp. BWR-S5]
MTTTVIFAEKRNQADDYAKCFQKREKIGGYYKIEDPIFSGKDVYIVNALGHLVSLAEPETYKEEWKNWNLSELPLIPENFVYQVSPDKEKLFKNAEKILKKADEIIIATDIDREGENVAWSCFNLMGLDKRKVTKRLWVNSNDLEEIYTGFKNLRDSKETYNYYVEAQTRQQSDWLVGMTASRLYTLLLQEHGVKESFSVGRVQTPTLFLVYERDQEIKNFKSQPYFQLSATVSNGKESFSAKMIPNEKFDSSKEVEKFAGEKNFTLGKNPGVISKVEMKEKEESSPLLFSLNALQGQANKLFKVSPQETLEAAQELYNTHKLLTYPRTSIKQITEKEHYYLKENIGKYLNLLGIQEESLQLSPEKRYVDNEKVKEHYAIIPQKKVPSPEELEKLPELQRKIYDLVLKTTVAMFLPKYKYDEKTITAQVNSTEFRAIGITPKNDGWKRLFGSKDKEANQEILPDLIEGEKVDIDILQQEKETKPPKKYTEGSLLAKMENIGKDTEDQEEKEILNETLGLGEESTRSAIIESLKDRKYIEVVKNKVEITNKGELLCSVAKHERLLSTPSMTAVWEKALKDIGKGERQQDQFLKDIQGFLNHLVKNVPLAFESEDVKNLLSIFEKEKEEQAAASIIGDCPICNEKVRDKGTFYGCDGYKNDPSCKFSLPKKWSKKTLPKSAIKQLLEDGITKTIKGFKRKSGGSFSAKLEIKDGELGFVEKKK